MPSVSLPGTELLSPLSARLWRVLPKGADPLSPAPSPEGRFHHSGQPALYLSPSAQSALRATTRRIRSPEDYVAQSYLLTTTGIVDLRRAALRKALGLSTEEVSRPWRHERKAGRPASSWKASDLARHMGADGLIWTARNAPQLWHLVLFDWPGLHPEGEALPLNGTAQKFLP